MENLHLNFNSALRSTPKRYTTNPNRKPSFATNPFPTSLAACNKCLTAFTISHFAGAVLQLNQTSTRPGLIRGSVIFSKPNLTCRSFRSERSSQFPVFCAQSLCFSDDQSFESRLDDDAYCIIANIPFHNPSRARQTRLGTARCGGVPRLSATQAARRIPEVLLSKSKTTAENLRAQTVYDNWFARTSGLQSCCDQQVIKFH